MGWDVRKISHIAGRNIECYRLIRRQYEYLLKLKKYIHLPSNPNSNFNSGTLVFRNKYIGYTYIQEGLFSAFFYTSPKLEAKWLAIDCGMA